MLEIGEKEKETIVFPVFSLNENECHILKGEKLKGGVGSSLRGFSSWEVALHFLSSYSYIINIIE